MVYSLHKRKKIKKWLLGGIIILGILWLYLLFNQITKTYWPKNAPTKATTTIDFSQETLEQLQKYNIEINSIEEQSNVIRLILKNNTTVLLAKNKNIEKQIEALQAIINQDKMSDKQAKIIDLRFKNPTISY